MECHIKREGEREKKKRERGVWGRERQRGEEVGQTLGYIGTLLTIDMRWRLRSKLCIFIPSELTSMRALAITGINRHDALEL